MRFGFTFLLAFAASAHPSTRPAANSLLAAFSDTPSSSCSVLDVQGAAAGAWQSYLARVYHEPGGLDASLATLRSLGL